MSSQPLSHLAVETQLYEAHKSEWLRTHRGEYVVLRDTDLLGFFSDFRAAYYAGVDKYGIKADFLVKRVADQEPVFVVF